MSKQDRLDAEAILRNLKNINRYPNRMRRSRARADAIIERNPEEVIPEPGNWTREERMLVRGCEEGGWLKVDVDGTGHDYSDHAQYLFQSAERREEIIEEMMERHATHAPVVVSNTKTGNDHKGVLVGDLWGKPDVVTARLQELVNAGIQPMLFQSDKDAYAMGIYGLIHTYTEGLRIWGHLISSVCPSIEMAKRWDKADWERIAEGLRPICDELGLPLWCHFGQDEYFHPKGYDGIWYQSKRMGTDEDGNPTSLRGPGAHRHKLAHTDQDYEGPQDLDDWNSPLRQSLVHKWTLVSFETCQLPTDTEADWQLVHDEGVLKGYDDVGVPARWC